MTKAALKFISDAMSSAGIPYEFMEFSSDLDELASYWVGEYSETEPFTEDGLQETQFILTGTTKGSWVSLESQKATIEELFPYIGGNVATLSNGNAIAIYYGNAFPVPTGDMFLKRIQINLTVKEWKVN